MATPGSDGSIILSTKIDQSGLTKGMTSMKDGVNNLMGSFKKLGAAIGIALGINALVQFGKQAITLASDLQEVQNVVDVAFGDMAYKIESFSKTAIENFGISELTAKRTASTYMAMAKGMGIVDDVASDMAITMTGLTADIASFYNMSQERADVILKSVYTGETETLKQLGIVMTEVNLEQFALSQGITKNISAMTQQEKTMLRYKFVMEQTKLAQGDFVRTQDSWANQTRILTERWKVMQTAFGEAFMTIGVLVLPTINKIINGLTRVAQAAQVVAQWIYKAFTGKELKSSTTATQGQASALSGVGSSAENAADGMADLGSSTKKANKEAKKAIAGFDDLEIITSHLADSADSAAGSMGEIGGGIGGIDANVDFSIEGEAPDTTWLDTFSAKLEPARAALGRLAEQLQPLKDFSSQALQDFYNLVLVPIGSWVLAEGFPRFVDAISNQLALVNWGNLNKSLEDLWNAVTPFAINIGEGLLWFWENAITPLIGWSLNNLIPGALDLVTSAINAVNEIIEAAKPALKWFWDTWIVPLRDLAWQMIIDFMSLLNDQFDRLAEWASTHQTEIEVMTTTILNFMGGLWLYNKTKNMVEFLSKLGKKFVGLAKGISVAQSCSFIGKVGLIALLSMVPQIIDAWKDMTPIQRVTTLLLGLVTAAFAAAAAVGAFQSAWSVGVAAVAITGGILAISSQISAAKKEAKNGIENLKAADVEVPEYNISELQGYARGTVVPPNKPHLAWFGDNTKEPEVVSPISTLKQSFKEAMLEMGGSFSGGNTEVVLEIDGREFGRAVVEQGNKENRRIGTRLVIV